MKLLPIIVVESFTETAANLQHYYSCPKVFTSFLIKSELAMKLLLKWTAEGLGCPNEAPVVVHRLVCCR
jgi:hypothetical protein